VEQLKLIPKKLLLFMKESPKKAYILYIGNNYSHKNLDRLKRAFDKLVKEYNLNYELKLITEIIGEEELDNLYKNASLFVLPSLCEGFGLPPLEAMKRGIPVVCSNICSLVEILGEAAIYFNPLDINEMAEKIKKVLENKDLRKSLRERGFELMKKYSWQRMAKETLRIYEKTPH